MKHIVLTNDDGIAAEGLRALYEALKDEYQVTVVAPDGQRSAVGHGVSFHKSFRVKKSDMGYAVSGTPADCVKWAILSLEEPIDLVVSGINRGSNLGVDVHYSGTASAAMEAVFYEIPAIAFSCHCREFKDSKYLGELSRGIVRAVEEEPLPPRRLLNVNFPNLLRGDPLEYVAAPLGFQHNEETLNLEGEDEYFYDGYYGVHLPNNGSDLDNVYARKICLTPLTWDLTDRGSMSLMTSIIRRQ